MFQYVKVPCTIDCLLQHFLSLVSTDHRYNQVCDLQNLLFEQNLV